MPDEPLIQALQNPAAYSHPVKAVELIETHISWVLLTGSYAYKIKKPVALGFLDFSTLEKRKFFCEEELRLNRRFAPDLYLAVVKVSGTATHPCMDGAGEAIEYAVKMRQFDPQQQLDCVLQRGELNCEHMDALAATVAQFHQQTASSPQTSPFGCTETILQPILENFSHIRESLPDQTLSAQLNTLEEWSRSRARELQPQFEQRKSQGFIRECHGDMHLRNMALIDENIVLFDCIEFNENLRYIDVMSEIAFLLMDLEDRHQTRLAQRFLNQYLEFTGDYTGLPLLRFYKLYRAMVRAKVDAIRAAQPDVTPHEQQRIKQDCQTYLDLAQSYTEEQPTILILNHGLSGSGKTTLSQDLLESLPAIRLRSDIERKRLFGITFTADAGEDVNQGIYSHEASNRTYSHLEALSELLLQNGYAVIVDASFLDYDRRSQFRDLATRLGLCCLILDFQAPAEILRQRIQKRRATGQDASDASESVLAYQLSNYQALQEQEIPFALQIDTTQPLDTMQMLNWIKGYLQNAPV